MRVPYADEALPAAALGIAAGDNAADAGQSVAEVVLSALAVGRRACRGGYPDDAARVVDPPQQHAAGLY
jgi:hypothetical protein